MSHFAAAPNSTEEFRGYVYMLSLVGTADVIHFTFLTKLTTGRVRERNI